MATAARTTTVLAIAMLADAAALLGFQQHETKEANAMTTYQQFFEDLNTVEDIKARYRELAKQHHPDLGGDPHTMQQLNQHYHERLKTLNGSQIDGREYKYQADIEQELMDILHHLLKLPKLDIALIGYWLWVTGDTKPHRDALKTIGLAWHAKRKCWYYKPKDWRTSKRSNCSLEELAAKYGYRHFQSEQPQALPAN